MNWSNPVNGQITSLFGERLHPVFGQKNSFHKGIDIGVKENTEIIAVTEGVVTEVKNSDSYGNTVRYSTNDGYEILYAHLNSILVKVGDNIKKGDIIALSGNTGVSTGPHLHYEITKEGKLLDPLDFVDLPLAESLNNISNKKEEN